MSHWIGPLCLHTLYIVSTTVYMHVENNNTIFNTTCLYIPMHSHNLSLVEKCVLFRITLAQLLIILYASAIVAYADFKSLFAHTMLSPYGVRERALILVHTPLCVYIVQMALYNSLSTSLAHTHTHTHTHTHINTTMATP